MTAPTDIDSFAYGFDLTSANYSGGAGGTFTNLVAGGENWTVSSATPSFTTKNSGTSPETWSLEGMDFTGSDTESIHGEHRALYESTILVIAQPTTGGSHYAYGGTLASANSFGLNINAYKCNAFSALGNSGATPVAASPTNVPHVWTITYSPENGTRYAQIDDGAVTSLAEASGSFEQARILHYDAAIGQHRTANLFTGWIARVLVFSRALHYRDNANLQSLITTEMAKIGL